VLIKSSEVLESSRRIDTVVFDKTGTLTTGQMQLGQVIVSEGESGDLLLARAASVESSSEHPVAAAVVRGAAERGIAIPAAREFESSTGRGAGAIVDDSLSGSAGAISSLRRDSRLTSNLTEACSRPSTEARPSYLWPGKIGSGARLRWATPRSAMRWRRSVGYKHWACTSR